MKNRNTDTKQISFGKIFRGAAAMAVMLSAAVAAVSCTFADDPLDKKSAYDIFKDSTRVENYVQGLYTFLPTGFNRFANKAMLSSAGDESTQSKPNHGLTPFVNGSWGPSSNPDSRWALSYEAIMQVNLFFENVHHLYPQTSEALKNHLTAEAHFLRAYFYFELVKRYGGVPLLKKTLDPNADVNIPRDTFEDCIDFIVEECEKAIPYLPEQETAARWGRASQVAARALKSRVLLYAASDLFNGPNVVGEDNKITGYGSYSAKRWETAAQAAFDIIENHYPGTVDLYAGNPANLVLRYRNVFLTVAPASNKEWIFVRTRQSDNAFEKDNAPISITNGSGAVSPSQNLVDAYQMKNGKAIGEQGSNYNPANPYANRDPRFNASIFFNGNTLWNQVIDTSVDGADSGFTNIDGTKTGYYLRKFFNEDARIFGTQANKPHFFPLFRFAEVLLNFAEAMNEAYGPEESGPYDAQYTAKWAVDLVRQRVGMPKLAAGLTYDQMKECIIHERRIELAFEEHRHWDVRRWKIAEDVFSQPIRGVRIDETADETFEYYDVEQRSFTPKMYLYPIPYSEMRKNQALVQNPLWEE